MIPFLRSARRRSPLPAVWGWPGAGRLRLTERFQMPAPATIGADKFLFDRGQEALAKRQWLDAREYFRRIIDTYPAREHRRDAKIGLGDSFLGERPPGLA